MDRVFGYYGFGLQAGGSETDVILLVMSPKGVQGLLKSKFTLGGEASVAAGCSLRESRKVCPDDSERDNFPSGTRSGEVLWRNLSGLNKTVFHRPIPLTQDVDVTEARATR